MKRFISLSLGVLLAAAFAAPAAVAAEKAVKSVEASGQAQSSVNTFNRLLKKPAEKNLEPAKDGIHDPENDNTFVLQPPKVAFGSLVESKFGNYVDWVKSLRGNKIRPRSDVSGTGEELMVMDLDIVREIKSTVADVVFPHAAHTEWLECSNCHPDIFVPQQGANRMNMAQIMLGQKCGVCHGKVAFPITTHTCNLCHAKPKPSGWKMPRSAASLENPWQ